MTVFNRNRSHVFTSKYGLNAMSSSPKSSSSSRYHDVNKKESQECAKLVRPYYKIYQTKT